MAFEITVAEVEAGLKAWAAFPIDHLNKVYAEHFASLADDEKTVEDVAQLLASVGVPYAAEVGSIVKLAGFLQAISSPAQPGDPGTYPSAVERSYLGQRDNDAA
jgi:hypothetical protein